MLLKWLVEAGKRCPVYLMKRGQHFQWEFDCDHGTVGHPFHGHAR